ncbi:MAG TPA: DNA-processing protein DprA [Trebonia sp.]|jgi:DNA processing protein
MELDLLFEYNGVMNVTERGALLALLRSSGQRWSAVADEVESAGSAVQVLCGGASGQMSLFELGGTDADALAEAAERDIRAWEEEGLRFVTLLDDDYPAQLLTVHQRPPFLMLKGRPDEGDARGVAIVGTRQASDEGVKSAHYLASALAKAGVPVVSGLAAGIDTGALSGALSVGGRAVAVIGTGLHHSYPKANTGLQERISRVGVVISQFLPDTPPTKATFPMRNAVMSGYTAATVVVEAPYKSGARMQARLALEHGRHVFLLESLLVNDWAQAYAKRPNTTVVRSVNDVLDRIESVLAADQDLVWA